MQTTETLAREACRGYQCDTFPEGSWVSEGDMLRTVAEAWTDSAPAEGITADGELQHSTYRGPRQPRGALAQ
jgi:hypothetical protein